MLQTVYPVRIIWHTGRGSGEISFTTKDKETRLQLIDALTKAAEKFLEDKQNEWLDQVDEDAAV